MEPLPPGRNGGEGFGVDFFPNILALPGAKAFTKDEGFCSGKSSVADPSPDVIWLAGGLPAMSAKLAVTLLYDGSKDEFVLGFDYYSGLLSIPSLLIVA